MVFWLVPDVEQIPHAVLAILAVASVVHHKYQRVTGIAFHAIAGLVYFLVPGLLLNPLVSDRYRALQLPQLQRHYPNGARYSPGKGVDSRFALFTHLFTAYHLYETKARGLHIAQNFLSCVLAVEGVWFAAEVYRLVTFKHSLPEEIDLITQRTQRWIEGKSNLRAQRLFWLDAVLQFCYALFNFAFPNQILRLIVSCDLLHIWANPSFQIRREYSLDGLHKMFSRQFGVYSLGIAMVSLLAADFAIHHQKHWVFQRILTQGLILLLHVYGYWGISVYSPSHVGPFMIALFYITFLLCIYFQVKRQEEDAIRVEGDGEVRTRVLSASKKTTKAA
ncbi:Protein C03A3.1 b [Aphelenchoides avenae]|nr:Protein C03A3.1 b [Aphelenchus avenae]